MRAVGEALGLGRTFPEAFMKAIEGREAGAELPAFRGRAPVLPRGARVDRRGRASSSAATGDVAAAKRFGLPDSRIAARARRLASARCGRGGRAPARLAVDSCAGEFEARTPYYYVTTRASDEGPEPSGAR